MSFKDAYSITKQQEGGYANDPDDRGGETYAGVARRYHAKWGGWAIVDYYKKQTRTQRELNQALSEDMEMIRLKQEFYKEKFWDPIDKYPFSQDVKIYLFDYAVNSGHKNAYKALQRALGVKADGVIGKKTLEAYAKAGVSLVAKLKSERDAFYFKIAKGSQKKYLNGWLKRSQKVLCHSMDCGLERKSEKTRIPKTITFWENLVKLWSK